MKNYQKLMGALLATTAFASPSLAQPDAAAAQPAQPAAGPASDTDNSGDILITARRRLESTQDVPLAVSAVNEARLEEVHATNITDLQNLTPSISLQRNPTNPTQMFPFIRGFGTKTSDPAAEPPVALSVDGIFYGTLIGSMIPLNDVEAVEVQRGPQGTLLGKNAPSGGVSIRTRRPGRDPGGRMEVTYGSFNDLQLYASVDVPLIADHLFATLSYFRERSDGYVRDTVTGQDIGGIATNNFRLGLLADLGAVTWFVNGSYMADRGEDPSVRNISDFSPLVIPTSTYCPTEQPLAADGFPGATRCRVNPATGAAFPGGSPPVSLTCALAFSRSLCTTGATFNGVTVRLPNTTPYTTQAGYQPTPGSPYVNVPRGDSWNAQLISNLDVDAGPVSLAFVTGWRQYSEGVNLDIDGTPLAILDVRNTGAATPAASPYAGRGRGPHGFNGNFRQISHEMRLASTPGGGLDLGGRLNWLVGVYYFNYDYDRQLELVQLGAPAPNYQDGTTNSYAAFAHAEFQVIDGLTISGGVRQTWDRKTHSSCATRCILGFINAATGLREYDPIFAQRANWDSLDYDATIQYDITPDNMIYVRRSTGYRGGGFTGTPASIATVATFDPESVKAWEIGSRNDFFNHRVRVNVTLFRADYTDLQRSATVPVPFPPNFVALIRNIARGRVEGFEVETVFRPITGLTLRANAGYVNARYTNFLANLTATATNPVTDNSGLEFPYAPKWTIQLGGTYEAQLGSSGSLTFSADWAYRSSQNYTDLNFAFGRQPGYGLLSGSITWRDESRNISVAVFGRNLTDKVYIDSADHVGGLTTWQAEGAPRSWGVTLGYRF